MEERAKSIVRPSEPVVGGSARNAPSHGGFAEDDSALPSDWLGAETLNQLHPKLITDPPVIRELLERVRREQSELFRGIDRWRDRETASILAVSADELHLRVERFRRDERSQIFLNFYLEGRPYFFAAPFLEWISSTELRVACPAVLYQAERRDRNRQETPRQITIRRSSKARDVVTVPVNDSSPDGFGIRLPSSWQVKRGEKLKIRPVDEEHAAIGATVEVRYVAPNADASGWRRIGLAVVPEGRRRPIQIDHRTNILAGRSRVESQRLTPPVKIERIEYPSRDGEKICALVDRCGKAAEATAIVIPPTWAQTKETMLPLARTLVATFDAAGESVTVIRFDGVRQRGESHNDSGCSQVGHETRHYTSSQGTIDILSTLDFLKKDCVLCPKRTLIISFSMCSIAARRVLAMGSRDALVAWISVFGAVDLQSMMRVISGGVDYLGGVERGASFGEREVNGLLIDIDRAAHDAIDAKNAFIGDARRDMAKIKLPVTWIHGRYDAWIDLSRVQDLMSHGDPSIRRLIEIPTGHHAKTSHEALETFQLIAAEALRLATGLEVSPVAPCAEDLRVQRLAERCRRTVRRAVNLRSFWRDFLVGRDGYLGFELLTNMRGYRELMRDQLDAVGLSPGDRVIDLGSGTGAFPLTMVTKATLPQEIRLIELDYVIAGLRRARELLNHRSQHKEFAAEFIVADLDPNSGATNVPLRSCEADVILASLLLNYLKDPFGLLCEAYRLLRPGGRLVLTSLRPDADISRMWVAGLAELRAGLGREVFGAEGERRMNDSVHAFVSNVARIIDLEERGYFHFWEPEELEQLAMRAGFETIALCRVYGSPPQAWMLTASRPGISASESPAPC